MSSHVESIVLLSGTGRLAVAIDQKLTGAGARVERVADSVELGSISLPALQSASVLVLAGDDDAGNVDIALTIRRLRPDLPLVVRLFDSALVTYLKNTLDNIVLLSVSAMAAPVFAEEATRAVLKPRLGSRGMPRGKRHAQWPHQVLKLDRVLVTAFLCFITMICAGTLFFAFLLDLAPLDALYFVWTTIATGGYDDIVRQSSPKILKVVGMILMFGGATFMAVLFAFFTGWVVTQRLNVLSGRVRVRGRNHVVIAGGGNVGFRVAGLLHEKEHRVVVIEKDAESRHIVSLRAAGHHVIVADATSDGILEMAGIERASTVLALTDSDATNLHVALLMRASNPGVPVVMRLESSELSAHVSDTRDAVAISPVAVAVEEFARAALEAILATDPHQPASDTA